MLCVCVVLNVVFVCSFSHVCRLCCSRVMFDVGCVCSVEPAALIVVRLLLFTCAVCIEVRTCSYFVCVWYCPMLCLR